MSEKVEIIVFLEDGARVARYYSPHVPRVGEKVGIFFTFYKVKEVYYRLDRVSTDNKDTALMFAVVIVEPTEPPATIEKMHNP